MRYAIAYLGTGLVMGVLDALWLTLAANKLYRPVIGSIMADKPNLMAAVPFYLIYVFGIVFFAVLPGLREDSIVRAASNGAVLGLVAYATYVFTNQAIMRVWSTHLSLTDLAWGVFLTGAAAAGGYWLTDRFAG